MSSLNVLTHRRQPDSSERRRVFVCVSSGVIDDSLHAALRTIGETAKVTLVFPVVDPALVGVVSLEPPEPPLERLAVPVSSADLSASLDFFRGLLWPALHGMLSATGDGGGPPLPGAAAAWRGSQRVLAALAGALAARVAPADVVLVLSASLLGLPGALRAALAARPPPSLPPPAVALCLRAPFPTLDSWRALPQRAELLSGLLAADIVLLPTFGDARALAAAATGTLGREAHASWAYDAAAGRFTAFAVAPLGVDARAFASDAPGARAADAALARELRLPPGGRLVVAADAPCFTRGVVHKLLAFEALLAARAAAAAAAPAPAAAGGDAPAPAPAPAPAALAPVTLALVLSPPPAAVGPVGAAQAAAQLSAAASAAGRINGAHSTPTHTPVLLLERALDAPARAALFRAAAVGFFVSAREGGTAEALEFVAAQPPAPPPPRGAAADDSAATADEGGASAEGADAAAGDGAGGGFEPPGVLLYSEGAGGAGALAGALIANAFDVPGTADALARALAMPRAERAQRQAASLAAVRLTDARAWAARALALAASAGAAARARAPSRPLPAAALAASYARAARRLLFFAWDGTLCPHEEIGSGGGDARGERASPPDARSPLAEQEARRQDALAALEALAADAANVVWVVSDAPVADVEAALGGLARVGLAAESGAAYRLPRAGAPWRSLASFGGGDDEDGGDGAREGAGDAAVAGDDGHGGVAGGDAGRAAAGGPTAEGDAPAPAPAPAPASAPAPSPAPAPAFTRIRAPSRSPASRQPTGERSSESAARAPAPAPAPWMPAVEACLTATTGRTPGSALALGAATARWSWAGALPDAAAGDAAARDVLVLLEALLFASGAEVLPCAATRHLIVRAVGATKGALLARVLSSAAYGRGVAPRATKGTAEGPPDGDGAAGASPGAPWFDFVLAAGDDRADEEMYPAARAYGEGRGWAVSVAAGTPRASGDAAPGAQPAAASFFGPDSGAPWSVGLPGALLHALRACGAAAAECG